MKKLLVLCPTSRERRALPAIAERIGAELIFDDFGGDYFDELLGESPKLSLEKLDIIGLIEDAKEKYGGKIDGVTSGVGYPGMSATACIAQDLKLPGPRPQAIFICEHKYLCRVKQAELVPHAAPPFFRVDPADLSTIDSIDMYPGFLKPVKSCMSINAFKIKSREELLERARTALLPEQFISPFNDMVDHYTEWHTTASFLLYEGLLSGVQVSLEGYVAGGEVVIMGIIDAIMFPGTYSFKRFQYPSKLPKGVLQRMEDTVRDFLTGIRYDNAMFNFELFYNDETDEIHIIEINPKIASQFPDLFEKVDGINSYEIMMRIALGEKPEFVRGGGRYKIAASCVLRTFEDQLVKKLPSKESIDAVEERYPATMVQVIATAGKKLSEQSQDANSYRYGLINMGAQSEVQLEENFEDASAMLDYELEPV